MYLAKEIRLIKGIHPNGAPKSESEMLYLILSDAIIKHRNVKNKFNPNMNQSDYFEVLFEGTSIQRSLIKANPSTLIIDYQNVYGSTYSLKEIIFSRYLKELKIQKNTDAHVCIESIPGVLREKMIVDDPISYISISTHIYFDKNMKKFKVPVNESEIIDCDFMTYVDKHHFCKVIRGSKTIQEVEPLLSAFFLKILQKSRYLSKIDNQSFLYPVHGFKEISETFSRHNALQGIGYYLSSDIKVNEIEGPEKYLIESPFSSIYAKRLEKDNFESTKYFRVILYSAKFYENCFYGSFDKMGCLVLNSATKTCPKDKFLIYFWKEEKITDDDLKKVGIYLENVEMDLYFLGNYKDKYIFLE